MPALTAAWGKARGDGLEARLDLGVWMAALLATAATGLFHGWRAGLGVGLGSGLSLLNFFWLKSGATALTALATATAAVPSIASAPALAEGEGPRLPQPLPDAARRGGMRFLLRFALLGGSLCAIFISHLVPFQPVVWGLLAVPAGTLAALVLELALELGRGLSARSTRS